MFMSDYRAMCILHDSDPNLPKQHGNSDLFSAFV